MLIRLEQLSDCTDYVAEALKKKKQAGNYERGL